MKYPFYTYLAAKYDLDSRSLNADVLLAVTSSIGRRDKLRWLDLGTGTGAMIRRLLDKITGASLSVIGVDTDTQLLALAQTQLRSHLINQGHSIREQNNTIVAESNSQSIRLGFENCSALNLHPRITRSKFDLVTAHALMDILPMQATSRLVARQLVQGGLFYSTLNYDGDTALLPIYQDQAFETGLLETYNESMEKRRVNGQATGGAKSGRRLLSTLNSLGFTIIAYGSSDWNITPLHNSYRNQDKICVESLLSLIRKEGTQHSDIDQQELQRWYKDRCRMVEQHRLSLIAHQLDILACHSY